MLGADELYRYATRIVDRLSLGDVELSQNSLRLIPGHRVVKIGVANVSNGGRASARFYSKNDVVAAYKRASSALEMAALEAAFMGELASRTMTDKRDSLQRAVDFLALAKAKFG